jgi:dihydrolipoamide dehydrogenase
MVEISYDVAILGSGPGGYVAAIRAGQLGLKTLLVEKDGLLGGTCLHVGCIPSKAFLHTAEMIDQIRRAKDFGIVADFVRLDWATLMKRKERVIRKLAGGISYLLRKNGVSTVQGYGRLAGSGKLAVETNEGLKEYDAKNIVLATGSEPRGLPGIEFDDSCILSNAEILSLKEQPARLAVIGAGAVGVEFASMFHSFGTKVTLIEVLPRVLPVEDDEVSALLAKSFRKRGIEVLTETRVEAVNKTSDHTELHFTLPDGGADSCAVDKLLVAVGRKPRTEDIGLESVGIETDKGTVPVDGFMRSKAPGVYAIGDIVASPQLAHVASAEGILAVETIAGHGLRPMNYQHIPGATYCHPEVASVGLTEAQAREQGFEVRVGKFPFSASSKAGVIGESEGFVKVVSERRYDELLGVHVVGAHATDLIAEAVVALEHEATSESLMRSVHAHPTLSEAVMEAAHAAFGQPIHA